MAAALTATMTRYGLPAERLLALIAARRFDLYDEPMATLADLEAYAEGASAGLIALAAHVLATERPSRVDGLARHAGIAQAITGLLYAFQFMRRAVSSTCRPTSCIAMGRVGRT